MRNWSLEQAVVLLLAAALTFWTTASPTASAAFTSAGPMIFNCLKLGSAIAPASPTVQMQGFIAIL
jgi:hypothetical protein